MVIKHGKYRTLAHVTWVGMKQRCLNKNNPSYKHYGGRGISVCERWHKFENFYADMGDRPAGYEIDRIDNDGNYEPGNCRWVTRFKNASNKRTTSIATIDGVTKPVVEWCRILKLDPRLVRQRMRRDGMGVMQALDKKLIRKGYCSVRQAATYVEVEGERMRLIDACRKLNLNYKTIYQRIKRDKIDPQRALAKELLNGRTQTKL